MSSVLPIHLTFCGIWLGCILTEALFERALLGKGRAQELTLVELHKRVDLAIEVPAFVGVLTTGILMLLGGVALSPGLLVKIGIGLAAVATNVYCVWLAFRRAALANENRWDAFAYVDHLQHRYGTVVLLGVLAALGMGIYLYVHG